MRRNGTAIGTASVKQQVIAKMKLGFYQFFYPLFARLL